jgi:putative spermidine/putrescine transport system ATP-binding protein
VTYLELVDLEKSYGSARAVSEVNLSVARGEFISFLGPSGCGKSTTLRMIAGLEIPTSGTIRLDGADITRLPANKRKVGLVFQNYALFPNMTVAENIGFGLKIGGKSPSEIARRVDEMLAIIKMASFAKRYPNQLSGGQQQRVALARAIAIQPTILLLDEPLSALDAKIRVDLRAEIRSIQQQLGITTIYVTHDQEEALSLSDRIVVMREGHVDQIGTPSEIYSTPATSFVASFVGTLNRIEAEVADASRGLLMVDGQSLYAAEPLSQWLERRKVAVGIRPETFTIVTPEDVRSHELNYLNGTVSSESFLGSIVRISLKLGSNSVVFDSFNHPHTVLPRLGDQITVAVPREACLVLDAVPPRPDERMSALAPA